MREADGKSEPLCWLWTDNSHHTHHILHQSAQCGQDESLHLTAATQEDGAQIVQDQILELCGVKQTVLSCAETQYHEHVYKTATLS